MVGLCRPYSFCGYVHVFTSSSTGYIYIYYTYIYIYIYIYPKAVCVCVCVCIPRIYIYIYIYVYICKVAFLRSIKLLRCHITTLNYTFTTCLFAQYSHCTCSCTRQMHLMYTCIHIHGQHLSLLSLSTSWSNLLKPKP